MHTSLLNAKVCTPFTGPENLGPFPINCTNSLLLSRLVITKLYILIILLS
jgi:hypothetical protein